jgi:hypothetical protein
MFRLERRENVIQHLARAEGVGGLDVVWLVIPADVGGLALNRQQLLHDLLLGGGELLGDGFEDGL